MAMNSTKRLVASAIWSLEDPLFVCTRSQHSPSEHLQNNCGIILFLKGRCFNWSLVLLCYCTVVPHIVLFLSSRTMLSYIQIRKNFASPNPDIALFLQRVLFREGCLRKFAQLVIRGGRLDWGGFKITRPLEY